MAISEVHEVHPSGDTLFVLHNSGAAFATCDYEAAWHNALPGHQSELSRFLESSLIKKESHGDQHETLSEGSSPARAKPEHREMRFQLCSAVLTSTSSFFKRSLSGNWKEIAPEPGYKWTLTASDWDGEAFLMLMNILHHKTRAVPRTLQLEKLAKVAVLVDYYGCHEAVELWAEIWISNLHSDGNECYYSRELLLRLTISWVFSEKEKFGVLTKVAIRTSRGPIHTLGLPIPYPIVVAIESMRISAIGVLIEGIWSHWGRLNINPPSRLYSRECLYMQLGYIDQNLFENDLKPLPSHPYNGFSLDALSQAIDKFGTLIKCPCKGRDHLQILRCNLKGVFNSAINNFEDGLDLLQFTVNRQGS